MLKRWKRTSRLSASKALPGRWSPTWTRTPKVLCLACVLVALLTRVVFASLLERLVESNEQMLDIRRAEVGLPPRLTRAEGASRVRARFAERALPSPPPEAVVAPVEPEGPEEELEEELEEIVVGSSTSGSE